MIQYTKNWVQSFVVLLACKNVAQSTVCMKRDNSSYKKIMLFKLYLFCLLLLLFGFIFVLLCVWFFSPFFFACLFSFVLLLLLFLIFCWCLCLLYFVLHYICEVIQNEYGNFVIYRNRKIIVSQEYTYLKWYKVSIRYFLITW